MLDRDYYPHPVSKLLDHGPIRGNPFNTDQWFDYVAHYGLDEVDVPPLIDLSVEQRIFNPDYPGEFYAPLHACRALGQLGDMAADKFLVQLLNRHHDDDLVENALVALTMVGPRALVRLIDYFEHPLTPPDSRIRAAEGIYLFAKRQPQRRIECIHFLHEALARYPQQSVDLNGFLVYYLTKLGATEAAETISQAFAAGQVDEDMNGSWAAVQVALGLANEADFTPDELLGAGDRQQKETCLREAAAIGQPSPPRRQIPEIGLAESYLITEHLKR